MAPPDEASEPDRRGWPWVTGSAPSAPEIAEAQDDDRGDWVPPSRRRFWGAKSSDAPAAALAPAEPPAAEIDEDAEHHVPIVEALAELETRDLDRPKKRHRRRKERKALLHDNDAADLAALAAAETADHVAELVEAEAREPEPPMQPESEHQIVAAEAPTDEAPVLEGPEPEVTAEAAAAEAPPEHEAPPRRRWWSRRARTEEGEDETWETGRPTWPWISGAPPAAESEAPKAVEAQEPTAVEAPVAEVTDAPEPGTEAPAAEAPAAEAPVAEEPVAEEPRHEPPAASEPEQTQPVPVDEETPRRRAQKRREAALAGAGMAGGAGLAAMVAEDDEETEPHRWAWLGTRRVAAVILLLLAAEIGYVVHLNTEGTSNKSATPPTTLATVPTPTTTAPIQQAPATTVPPTTVPASTPTTVAKPAPKPAVAAAQTTPLAPCTTSDLNVVTTARGATEPSGAFAVNTPITVTTTVSAVRSCIFQPAAVPPGHCASWVVVNYENDGSQAFPSTTNTESCNPPAGQTMNPGSSESVSISFIPTAVGTYQAIGTWGWAAQSGPPNQVNVPSQPFAVSNS